MVRDLFRLAVVSMTLRQAAIWAMALTAIVFVLFRYLAPHPGGERMELASAAAWERMVSPGALASPHAFLEHDCAACHTPYEGAVALRCVTCHANETSLLTRQPTAFHADIGACRDCHYEHRGVEASITLMEHETLVEVGLRELVRDPDPQSEARLLSERLLHWNDELSELRLDRGISPRELMLDCARCHKNDDRHFEYFGEDCVQCHATDTWTIPAFRHPSPSNLDCAQCHQAPPSHYMGHFTMISQRVAGKPHAQVIQCHLCHQTTSWPDIVDAGWYKHH